MMEQLSELLASVSCHYSFCRKAHKKGIRQQKALHLFLCYNCSQDSSFQYPNWNLIEVDHEWWRAEFEGPHAIVNSKHPSAYSWNFSFVILPTQCFGTMAEILIKLDMSYSPSMHWDIVSWTHRKQYHVSSVFSLILYFIAH